MRYANIVHAEFFHGKKPKDLDEIFAQVNDRVIDQAPIKTTVRFYDYNGVVTKHVKQLYVLRRRREVLSDRYNKSTNLLSGFCWRMLYIRARQKHIVVHVKNVGLVADELAKVVNTKKSVAIEDDYRGPLRYVHDDERHELVESVRQSYNVSVWIFAGNDLIANKNKTIVTTLPIKSA